MYDDGGLVLVFVSVHRDIVYKLFVVCLLFFLFCFFLFFFNATATTEIYTLSLHDALPISYNQLKRELKQEKKESLVFERNGKEIYLLGFEYFGHYGCH